MWAHDTRKNLFMSLEMYRWWKDERQKVVAEMVQRSARQQCGIQAWIRGMQALVRVHDVHVSSWSKIQTVPTVWLPSWWANFVAIPVFTSHIYCNAVICVHYHRQQLLRKKNQIYFAKLRTNLQCDFLTLVKFGQHSESSFQCNCWLQHRKWSLVTTRSLVTTVMLICQ